MAKHEAWPELPYDQFKSTAYLLHMELQAIGKLKLLTPFEPHWANVALWVTSRGLTTGDIPYGQGIFSVDVDFINHQIICTTSWGRISKFHLIPTSVAQLTKTLFDSLHDIGIDITVNPLPQEIPQPILFDKDTALRDYDAELANAWWRILVSTQKVLQRYHARFNGVTPPIGLMWGTLDLRDARYNNTLTPIVSAENTDFIRRNAMDVAQVEVGWWSGNENYPRPAYFSFIYPHAAGIEHTDIQPSAAHWDSSLKEFILDYDDVRKADDPENDLLTFFESTYQAEAEKSGWDPKLIGAGKPI